MQQVQTSILILAALAFLLIPPDAFAQKPLHPQGNARNDKLVRAFTEAAMKGDLNGVKSFLERGVSVNAEPSSHKSWTALMAAATFGRAEIVKFLLAKGADARVKLKDGETTLYQAAQNGNREAIEALLAAGAELNAKTVEGRTALIRAAWLGHADAVKVLLDAGADTAIKDKDGSPAFEFAAISGDAETVKAFLRAGANVNARDGKGETPLMWATWSHRDGSFHALLDAGADVNARSDAGETPLMSAARLLDSSKVKILLNSGADARTRDLKGWTALMYAASRAKLRQGDHDIDYITRVFIADKLAEDLIAAGVDVNARASGGETALTLAVKSGHGGMIKVLLANGADVRPIMKFKDRIVDLYSTNANEESRVPLRKLLKNFGPK